LGRATVAAARLCLFFMVSPFPDGRIARRDTHCGFAIW
jgi:hypothetical protein